MKKQAAPAQSGPDAGPWVDLSNGRSRSASTGKMRYDPSADPEYQHAIKRIQGQEQAAAAKASSAANQRTLSIVDAVLGGRLGKAGCAIGSYTGGYVGASLDSGTQQPVSQPPAIRHCITFSTPKPSAETVEAMRAYFASVAGRVKLIPFKGRL